MESMHHPPNDPDHPCHEKEEGRASEGDVLFMKMCFLNHTVSFSKLALASYSTRTSACSQVSTHTHYLCSYLVWMNVTVRGQYKCTGSVCIIQYFECWYTNTWLRSICQGRIHLFLPISKNDIHFYILVATLQYYFKIIYILL